MIQIKKLVRPSRKSGERLAPGETSKQKAFGVAITNTGKSIVYVDRVTPKKKKAKKKK